MEASQAFYGYLWRTLARSRLCRDFPATSKSYLTQPKARRKTGIRAFSNSVKLQQPEEQPTRSPDPTAPKPAVEAPSTPVRSFRRQTDGRENFTSKFESPAPPSFSATSAAPEKSPKTLPPGPEAARRNIALLLDDAFGPVKDIIPPSTRGAGGTAKSTAASYDELSAYETKPRAPRPLTQQSGNSPTYDLLAALDASDIARDHEASTRLRLKPTLGRTVGVNLNRNIDLTRAFRMLEFKNQANKVKQDEREQRFHVRKGQMRKIMRRRRWRVTFMAGYLKECERVRRMRKQGW